MTQTYPFTRGKAAGWANGEILTSAQANTMDANAAQAADGLIWTDHAIPLSWQGGTAATNSGLCCGYVSTLKRWFNLGANAGNPVAWESSGGGLWVNNTNPAASVGLTVSKHAFADGLGIALFGGTPGSASANKLREVTPSGTTSYAWNTRATTTAGTSGVLSLVYHTSQAAFLAGLSTGEIERSIDGSSWSTTTVPDSDSRAAMATDGTTVVVVGGADRCSTSTSGTSWTQRTMPTGTYTSVCWSASYAKFFAVGSSIIASSADGITWSASGLTNPGSGGQIVAYRRALVLLGGYISLDGGATWYQDGRGLLGLSPGSIAVGDHQLVSGDATNEIVWWTQMGGGI